MVFVDSAADHVAAINARGLAIAGPIFEDMVHAPAFLPDDLDGVFDTVFLCVKAHHTQAAAIALAPHVAPNGCVVSAQNGLNELVIADIVGPDRTVGCFVNFGADYLEPGLVHYSGHGAVVVGELDGATTPRIEALHAMLADFEPKAVLTDNILGYLWGKLVYGALLFATALTDDSIADVLAASAHRPILTRLAREVGAVANAAGIRPRALRRLRSARLPARRIERDDHAFLRRHGRPQPPLDQVAQRHLARSGPCASARPKSTRSLARSPNSAQGTGCRPPSPLASSR